MATNAEPTGRERLVDPKLLQAIGNMRLMARSVVEGVVAGLHRSALKGASVEFTEYKEYSPGDETRHIDWRTFARTDKYFVKQFEDETNLRAYMMLDTSGSMHYSFEDTVTKYAYATYLVAALAYLFVRQGDAVGLLTFADTPQVFLPASSKNSHLDDLFGILEEPPDTDSGTDLTVAFTGMAERAPRRSLVFVLTDMLDTAASAMSAAKVLRQRKNEVVIFHLVDPAELTLPFEGLSIFEGLEGDGELLVDPDDIRDRYKEELFAYFESVERDCRDGDIEYWRVTTTAPLDTVILDHVFARRSRRR